MGGVDFGLNLRPDLAARRSPVRVEFDQGMPTADEMLFDSDFPARADGQDLGGLRSCLPSLKCFRGSSRRRTTAVLRGVLFDEPAVGIPELVVGEACDSITVSRRARFSLAL